MCEQYVGELSKELSACEECVKGNVGSNQSTINPFPARANPFPLDGYIFVNSARFITTYAGRLGEAKEGSYIYDVN